MFLLNLKHQERISKLIILKKDCVDLMNDNKTYLTLIDKSYPIYSEFLNFDNWNILHNGKLSAIFIPLEKKNSGNFNPESKLFLKKEILKSEIAEK